MLLDAAIYLAGDGWTLIKKQGRSEREIIKNGNKKVEMAILRHIFSKAGRTQKQIESASPQEDSLE